MEHNHVHEIAAIEQLLHRAASARPRQQSVLMQQADLRIRLEQLRHAPLPNEPADILRAAGARFDTTPLRDTPPVSNDELHAELLRGDRETERRRVARMFDVPPELLRPGHVGGPDDVEVWFNGDLLYVNRRCRNLTPHPEHRYGRLHDDPPVKCPGRPSIATAVTQCDAKYLHPGHVLPGPHEGQLIYCQGWDRPKNRLKNPAPLFNGHRPDLSLPIEQCIRPYPHPAHDNQRHGGDALTRCSGLGRQHVPDRDGHERVNYGHTAHCDQLHTGDTPCPPGNGNMVRVDGGFLTTPTGTTDEDQARAVDAYNRHILGDGLLTGPKTRAALDRCEGTHVADCPYYEPGTVVSRLPQIGISGRGRFADASTIEDCDQPLDNHEPHMWGRGLNVRLCHGSGILAQVPRCSICQQEPGYDCIHYTVNI